MRIMIVGTGYVGLVSGACFSELGHNVTCVDNDATKIKLLNAGEIPIFEPGLKNLVGSNAKAGRLSFTTDLANAAQDVDAIFIAVGTPSRHGDGHADLSYVFAAAEEISDVLHDYTVIISKSTVPVGSSRKIEEIIRKKQPTAEFDVVANPEFLREGSAIEDFMRPNRIVIGTSSGRARAVLGEVYRPLFLNETPVLFTKRETAEMIKYASNAFLAIKIGFINEMANLCEQVGADIQDVAKGMGMDNRIGAKFLNAGPGYGGSCFPKDTLALMRIASEVGVETPLVSAVVSANDKRKKAMAEKIIRACGGSVKGKKIAVLGLTFKPETNDMRDSPALVIVPALQEAGGDVHAFDPEGMEEAKKMLHDVTYRDDVYDTMEGADVVVILTEWNQFRALDFDRLRDLTRSPVLVDLRNVYGRDNMIPEFIDYHGIGKG